MHCVRNLLRALAALALAASLRGAEAPRVATIDFSLAETAGSHDAEIINFSRDVQARLVIHNEYSWIERQDFDRIQHEVDLAGMAQVDATSAVRLGHWLHADLLLRGEISRPTTGHGELTIEVIDLKRAELLATRKTSVTVNLRNLVRPVPADADAAASAAFAALKEASEILERNKSVRVIAPLFFRNSGPTERLNYLESRLSDALAKAASPESGSRLLRFPRTGEAGDEAGLVCAGLTDSDPDAWQQVADYFVWGTFSEGNSEGVAFNDVPVTIAVQVWSGAGASRDVHWEGLVRDLDQGVQLVTAGVMEQTRVRSEPADRTDQNRKRISTELAARTHEIVRRMTKFGSRSESIDFQHSPTGRHLRAYCKQLLEIACFFDPLNCDLQGERLSWSAPEDSPDPAETLRRYWLRFADLESHARRFEWKPDGSFDWNLRVNAAETLESIRHLIPTTPTSGGKWSISIMTPEESLRQFRSAVELWCREMSAANRPFAGKAVPEHLESINKDELYHFKTECLHRDAIIARNAVEKVWPWLKKAAGKELRNEPNSDLPACIISIYAAFGDFPRASALLDEAWAAGGDPGDSASSSNSAMAATKTVSEKSWLPAKLPGGGSSQPVPPPLNAAVRELDLWPANFYNIDRDRDRPLTKHRWPRVTSLVWHRGELWVGQGLVGVSFKDALPYASDNYLWRYDPVLQTTELSTLRLHAHSAANALISQPEGLWIGLASDGVWQWPAGKADVRRFRGEDGLSTSQIRAATSGHRSLFFLGGTVENRVISYYSLDAGTWFSVQVPEAFRNADSSGRPPTSSRPEIAVSGDWIAVIAPAIGVSVLDPIFYNLADKAWTRWPGGPTIPLHLPTRVPGSARPFLPGPPPMMPRPPVSAGYTSLSADESGFWLGSANAILQLDPRAPEKKRLISLPGTPVAAAHDGVRLWLVLESKEGDPKLALLDKNSGQCTGLLTLPVADLRLLVGDTHEDPNRISPEEMHFDRIAVAEGHVWVGGPVLFEITLREASACTDNTGGPADHPLHRAVWRGDLAAIRVALTAKADVNESSSSGWTPLLAAVDIGREDIVRTLLNAGAQPNQLSVSGRSPLELASERGDHGIVRVLLESGAQPDLNPGVVVRGLGGFSHPVEPPLTRNLDATVEPAQPTNLQASLTDDGGVALSWENLSDNESVISIERADSRTVPKRNITDLPAGSRSWTDETPPRGADVGYRVYALNGAKPFVPYEDEPTLWLKVPAEPPARVIVWTPSQPKPLPPTVESQTPLMAAARNGHLPVVKALLAAKASIDQRDPVGQTALLFSARSGHYEIARALLAAGAHADIADVMDGTAAQAVYERHEDESLLREMLMALDPGRRAREASRLILFAAGDGQIHDIETLRELGGNIDATTLDGGSALSVAIANRQLPTVTWLLEHGFSLHRKIWTWKYITSAEQAALETAKRIGDPQCLATLLAAEDSANRSIGKASALPARKARATWSPPDGTGGMTCGPDVFGTAPDPAKAALNARLFIACKKNDCDAVAGIIAEGAQIDVQDSTGMRPLTLALQARAFRTAQWLVENGASINLPTRKGNCPLVFAIEAQDIDISTYLLRAGADPNAFGQDGKTPLIVAAEQRNCQLAELLLDCGADPNLAAMMQSQPLAFALRKGDSAMVELLLARGANPRAQSFQNIVDSRTTKRTRASLLMYAAAGGNVDLIRKMIGFGQDPRYITEDGYDALAWAASQGHEAAIELLLPLVDHSPRALEMALENGHEQIAERLRRAGYQ